MAIQGEAELRRNLLVALGKLNEKDTQQNAVQDLLKIVQRLRYDHLSSFLNCIYDTDGQQKGFARKECIKQYGNLAIVFGDSLAPHVPRIMTAILKRFRDPEPGMADVIGDTIGVVVARVSSFAINAAAPTMNKMGSDDAVVKMEVFLRPVVDALNEQHKVAQATAAVCLGKMFHKMKGTLEQNLERMVPRMVRACGRPGFQAKAEMMLALSALAEVVGSGLTDFMDALAPLVLDAFNCSEWAARKAAADTLSNMAIILETDCLTRHKAGVTQALEKARGDKIKHVREAALQALKLWQAVPGAEQPAKASSSTPKRRVSARSFSSGSIARAKAAASDSLRDTQLGMASAGGGGGGGGDDVAAASYGVSSSSSLEGLPSLRVGEFSSRSGSGSGSGSGSSSAHGSAGSSRSGSGSGSRVNAAGSGAEAADSRKASPRVAAASQVENLRGRFPRSSSSGGGSSSGSGSGGSSKGNLDENEGQDKSPTKSPAKKSRISSLREGMRSSALLLRKSGSSLNKASGDDSWQVEIAVEGSKQRLTAVVTDEDALQMEAAAAAVGGEKSEAQGRAGFLSVFDGGKSLAESDVMKMSTSSNGADDSPEKGMAEGGTEKQHGSSKNEHAQLDGSASSIGEDMDFETEGKTREDGLQRGGTEQTVEAKELMEGKDLKEDDGTERSSLTSSLSTKVAFKDRADITVDSGKAAQARRWSTVAAKGGESDSAAGVGEMGNAESIAAAAAANGGGRNGGFRQNWSRPKQQEEAEHEQQQQRQESNESGLTTRSGGLTAVAAGAVPATAANGFEWRDASRSSSIQQQQQQRRKSAPPTSAIAAAADDTSIISESTNDTFDRSDYRSDTGRGGWSFDKEAVIRSLKSTPQPRRRQLAARRVTEDGSESERWGREAAHGRRSLRSAREMREADGMGGKDGGKGRGGELVGVMRQLAQMQQQQQQIEMKMQDLGRMVQSSMVAMDARIRHLEASFSDWSRQSGIPMAPPPPSLPLAAFPFAPPTISSRQPEGGSFLPSSFSSSLDSSWMHMQQPFVYSSHHQVVQNSAPQPPHGSQAFAQAGNGSGFNVMPGMPPPIANGVPHNASFSPAMANRQQSIASAEGTAATAAAAAGGGRYQPMASSVGGASSAAALAAGSSYGYQQQQQQQPEELQGALIRNDYGLSPLVLPQSIMPPASSSSSSAAAAAATRRPASSDSNPETPKGAAALPDGSRPYAPAKSLGQGGVANLVANTAPSKAREVARKIAPGEWSWALVQERVKNRNVEGAYAEILKAKEASQVVRLMGRTGPVWGQLSEEVAQEMMRRMVELLHKNESADYVMQWMRQLMGMVAEAAPDCPSVPSDLQDDLLEALHAAEEKDSGGSWVGHTARQISSQLKNSWGL